LSWNKSWNTDNLEWRFQAHLWFKMGAMIIA
jgi:hypothetical protein